MKWFEIENKLNEKEIQKLTKKLDVTLPEDYLKQIGKINGGALADAYIVHPTMGEVPYSRNIPLDDKAEHNIYVILNRLGERMKGLFPFADDDFGDYYCFDLEKDEVVLWLHETDKTEYVCKSFTELMNMIKTENEC